MVTHNICRIQILRMDIQEIESVKNLLFNCLGFGYAAL